MARLYFQKKDVLVETEAVTEVRAIRDGENNVTGLSLVCDGGAVELTDKDDIAVALKEYKEFNPPAAKK